MEISFKDIMRIIKKNIIPIVAISLFFAFVSFIITAFFIPQSYTSHVKLYVETSHDNNSSYEDLQGVNYASKIVSTYIELLNTSNFYKAVSKELGNTYSATQLNKAITFSSIENTELFEAKITANDPKEVQKIGIAVAKTAPITLSKLKSNATLKVVDEVSLPSNPSSPSTSKNVIIAFIIGLVIALVIAFVRDFLDIKIKYSNEMTTIRDIPILAAIPDFEIFINKNSSKTQTNLKTE